jgi:hypothetical protein
MGLEKFIAPLLERIGVPYDVTFLDYYLISVSPHLLGEDGTTLIARGADDICELAPIVRPLPAWVQVARRRLACSRDLAARLAKLVPGLSVVPVRAPEVPQPETYRVTPPIEHRPFGPLRVIVIGALVKHKGSGTIIAVAEEAKRRNLPIEFHQVGICEAISPQQQISSGLRLYGLFERQCLAQVICEIRPHIAWFPAQAPETHCFALSDAMLMGLPILARGIGAFPERLAGRPFTWVTPADKNSCEFWLEQLLALHGTYLRLPTIASEPAGLPPLVDDFYGKHYVDDV